MGPSCSGLCWRQLLATDSTSCLPDERRKPLCRVTSLETLRWGCGSHVLTPLVGEKTLQPVFSLQLPSGHTRFWEAHPISMQWLKITHKKFLSSFLFLERATLTSRSWAFVFWILKGSCRVKLFYCQNLSSLSIPDHKSWQSWLQKDPTVCQAGCREEHSIQCLKEPHCFLGDHTLLFRGAALHQPLTVTHQQKKFEIHSCQSQCALPQSRQLGQSDLYRDGPCSTQENRCAVPSSAGHFWLFWLEIPESAQCLVEAPYYSFSGSSLADCYFPSLSQIHSPSLTHLPSAQTPSRRVMSKHSFDLSFGNPEAKVPVGI